MSTRMSEFCVKENVKIKEIIRMIEMNNKGAVLVVSETMHLIGIITDGDIRRSILNGISFDKEAKDIMNTDYIFVGQNSSYKFIKKIFEIKKVLQLPVLDDDGKVIDLIRLSEMLGKKGRENYAVIMAGGLGTRLRPLTTEIPKPMLKVGEKPILEIIINQLQENGFKNIILTLNYKAEIIESYFRDGSDFGVNITYIHEKERLGTAGALKHARKYLDKPFIMMNGDLLTKINFDSLFEYHKTNNFDITIGSKKYDIQVPYGVLEIEGMDVKGIEEKPLMEFFINGGIYCLNPEMIDMIPDKKYYDITELIDKAMKKEYKIGSFPIREYWLDIGQMPDYEKAVREYDDVFKKQEKVKRPYEN